MAHDVTVVGVDAPSVQGGQALNRRALVAAYYTAFVSLGLYTSAIGPTLPGLAGQVNVGLAQISVILTAHGLGYAAGSLLSGRLYDRLPGHKIMAGALAAMALGMALIPGIPWVWGLTGLVLAVAMAEGALDVGGNALIIWAYGREVGPVMNGLHLFFGIGALLAPLIVAQVIVLTGVSQWTYWALAPLMLPAAIWLLRLRSPTAPPPGNTLTGRVDWLIIGILALFQFFTVGAEASFGNWIYTYGTGLGLVGKTGGAYLTSLFWGAFTGSRLLGVAAAMRWQPGQILLLCTPGALLGALVLALFPSSQAMLWVGSGLFGFAFGPIFPAVLALTGRVTRVTGQATSVLFLGSSLGMMLTPWFIGQLIEPVGLSAVMVTIMAVCALGVATLGAALWRAHALRVG